MKKQIKKMKKQIKIYSLLGILLGSFPSYSYPWMFFREKNSSDTIRLDSHSSYFGKKMTFFSGVDINYHNNMADINLGYTYSYLEKNHYFRLSEISLDFPFLWKHWTFSLGVKDVVWSEADRYWNYGLWQPRYLLDPFRPQQMGMPGLYFNYENQGSSLVILMSYLQSPDIVIYPDLINDKVSSRNPFFTDTSEVKVEELGGVFQLKKFLKPSFAVQFKNSTDIFDINFSYAYKGKNQLKKAFVWEGVNLSLFENNGGYIKKLDYFTNFHHLASIEAELSLDRPVSIYASFLYERPERIKLAKQWWSIDFPSHYTFSVLAYFQEKQLLNTLFTIGWTQTTEFDTPIPENLLINDFRGILSQDIMWKSAISVSVEHENKQLYEGVLFRLRGNYALDNQFYHLILENYFYFTPYFRFYLSGDMLLRFSERPVVFNSYSSAIKKYAGLNRILLGGQYVF